MLVDRCPQRSPREALDGADVHYSLTQPAETLPSSSVITLTLTETSGPSEMPTTPVPGGPTPAPPMFLPASSSHRITSPGSNTPDGNVALSPRGKTIS